MHGEDSSILTTINDINFMNDMIATVGLILIRQNREV